jgi:hypothetical protein
VPVVSPAELCRTAFSEAHLRGCAPSGSGRRRRCAVEIRRELEAGERFVYATTAVSTASPTSAASASTTTPSSATRTALVADILSVLPTGTALLVTADHGQVSVGDRIVVPSAELLSLVTMQSGEGRFRWLHARKGAIDELAAAAEQRVRAPAGS